MTNLLTKETALMMAVRVVDISGLSGISKDVYEQIGWSRVFDAIAGALRHAQIVGLISGLSESLETDCDCDFCDELKDRLRELQAELERIS